MCIFFTLDLAKNCIIVQRSPIQQLHTFCMFTIQYNQQLAFFTCVMAIAVLSESKSNLRSQLATLQFQRAYSYSSWGSYSILQIVQGGKVQQFSWIDWYRKTFPVKQPVQQALPCKTTIQPQMFSSELKFGSAITKLFYLKQFAIYGSQLIIYGQLHIGLAIQQHKASLLDFTCFFKYRYIASVASCSIIFISILLVCISVACIKFFALKVNILYNTVASQLLFHSIQAASDKL